ncbi:cell adhesion molecule DSCAM-like isoform X3 [Limanda limanda]|uniref:cell adhesion molecule DSCAM-like isoform X3 n=1 Tax=Limanda limanda TaxID=27771 RepID=UPI0029C91A2B|nr:cell adhesion molecule DSCAM-like isoform X3 [Limanda limanda]
MVVLGSRHLPLCCSLLLCLLLGCVPTEGIIATVGTDATLLCNYDAKYYGKLPVCWGRGAIPNSGCANEVIKSDGRTVVHRLTERYLLMGNQGAGDVSLTIRQVEESDSGTYGCRVDIPGWFNDHKHQVTLTVVAVRPDPLMVQTREVKERSVTIRWNPVFDGGRPITSYMVDLKNKQTSWDTGVRTEISNPELTQVTLVDLRPAKSYNIRMFVVNSIGMSEASNVLTITTKEAAPEGTPLDMRIEALTSHSIKVTWKPPSADLRNGVLQSYSVSYREYDPAGRQYKRWQHQSVTATQELESLILSNLKPSTKYGVIIQAKTKAGIGPASTAPLCSTLDEVHTTSEVVTVTPTSTDTTMQKEETSRFTTAVESVTDAIDWEQSTSSFTSVHTTSEVVTVTPTSTDTTMQRQETSSFTTAVESVTDAIDWEQSTSSFTSVHTTSEVVTVTPTSTDTTMQREETSSFTTVESVTDAIDWDQSTSSFTSVPPDPPVVELKEVIDTSISLCWTPGFEGDSPITGYYLEYKALNASWDYTKAVVDFSPNQTEATIIEINPSTYNIRMFAKNSLGTSKASNVLTITTGRTGHQKIDTATTVSSELVSSEPLSPDAAASVNGSHNGHLAAIVMSVVLVVLIVAIVTTWQIRRVRQKEGSLSLWESNLPLRLRDSESLQEL